ncbi:MAG: chromosome partitioning protein ParB [Candidatus Hydrogenedentota bacterium]
MGKDKKGGLGRGLGALITGKKEDVLPEDASYAVIPPGERIFQLDPRELRQNPKQPRTRFDEDTLQELADSIRADGVIEPIVVRKSGDGYEIVSGERRTRASIMADLETVPAIVRDVSDADMLKLGIIENIQREDLNAIELAKAYQQLIDELGWTQDELARQVGKKRATITNTLRLLNLPKPVQERVGDGSISMGHARALLSLPSRDQQIAACRKIMEQGLSVRQVEKLAEPAKPATTQTKPKSPHVSAIEDELRSRLGTRVTLRTHEAHPQRGKIEIEYFTLDELERILDLLRQNR